MGVYGVSDKVIYKKSYWQKTYGRISELSIGVQTLWAVTSKDKIYRRKHGKWEYIRGSLNYVNDIALI